LLGSGRSIVVSLAIIRFLFASSFAQAARSRKACVNSFCW
jgi:hypothetical protein